MECVCRWSLKRTWLGGRCGHYHPPRKEIMLCLEIGIPATNNDVEYEATGLEIAAEIGIHSLCLHSDSQLIVNQILGEFQTHGERLTEYLRRVQVLLGELEHYIIKHIPREENHEVDGLAKQASMGEGLIQGTIPVQNQARPRFEGVHEIALTEDGETWMTPITTYLSHGILPTGRNERRQLLRKSPRYTIQDGVLYCRVFFNPLLRCVVGKEAKGILHNTHQRSCGDHTGGQTLVKKILRYGYF